MIFHLAAVGQRILKFGHQAIEHIMLQKFANKLITARDVEQVGHAFGSCPADNALTGQGIICWTRTEGMADLFNIPGRYELVCEFLKHDMLYRLMAELEDALPDGSEMENHEI